MNRSLDKALHFLTGTPNIHAATVDELEKLVNDHPYFSIAQLLLAKKLADENDPRFLPQVQKTALYFSNPYWLHYQLQKDIPTKLPDYPLEQTKQEDVVTEEHRHKSIIIDKEQLPEQLQLETNQDNNKEVASEKTITTYEPQPIVTEFSADETETNIGLLINNIKTSIEKDRDVTQTDNEIIGEKQEPAVSEDDKDSEERTSPINETSDKEANDLTEVIDTTPNQTHAEPVSQPEEEMAAISREADETTEQFLNELEKQQPEKEGLKPLAKDEAPLEAMSSFDQQKTLAEVEEPEAYEPDDTEEIDEHEKMFQNIKAMLDSSAKEANADVKNANLPIDPYYTIDYFASQGIKLDLKKNQPDKLGKQVKRFTQWLKHMKKLGPEDALASEGISPEEVEAQRMADVSNTAREVVTEAMALVLEKQGKKDKAVQLYRKLTFLNPDKSAYFASKIKHLNGT